MWQSIRRAATQSGEEVTAKVFKGSSKTTGRVTLARGTRLVLFYGGRIGSCHVKITSLIWLEQVVDKLERKHHVSVEEVKQVFINQPRFLFRERGRK